MQVLLAILFSITAFGAIGDGATDNTLAINRAVASCAERGGGVVSVPQGVFITGTVFMRSNVTLRLERGAVIKGTDDLSAYSHLRPVRDLSRFDSGQGSVNQNCASDTVWTLSLIQFVGVSHSGICGEGTIDGSQVFNANGEEHQRGPHTVLIASCKDLTFSGFQILRASNYAILAYDISRCRFSHLRINGGWDGIHIRGARGVKISHCYLHTGDDAIAGGYWDGLEIKDCTLNSSCNGIRMIQPSRRLTVEDCLFYGPGAAPHITTGRRQSLNGISLEPGAWGFAPGKIDKVRLRRLTFRTLMAPISVTLSDENSLGRLLIEDIKATDITRMALSVKSWGRAVSDRVTVRRVSMSFRNVPDSLPPDWFKSHSTSLWPYFPSYAMYFRNVRKVKLKDIRCAIQGPESRPATASDNVGEITESRVSSIILPPSNPLRSAL